MDVIGAVFLPTYLQDIEEGIEGVDESLIYGPVGMLHVSIAGQLRQLMQIASVTHKISCQSVALASSIPDNEVQLTRAKYLRTITQELTDALNNIGNDIDKVF